MAQHKRVPKQETRHDDDAADTAFEEKTSARRRVTSGTLANRGDTDELPVVDEGMAVGPEDLGVQFLRNATEQNNFESELHHAETEPGAYPLGQLISEGTLSAAGQDDVELPGSAALEAAFDGESEPEQDVDLTNNGVREASLFDRGVGGDAPLPDTRAPLVDADESTDLDEHAGPSNVDPEAREEEMRRMREALRKNPDRRSVSSDRETWEANRHTGGGRKDD